jgi:hypothetical protein
MLVDSCAMLKFWRFVEDWQFHFYNEFSSHLIHNLSGAQ